MPELPDITVYIEALESRILGQPLQRTRIAKPFLLRSVDPPISAAQGKRVTGVRRMGKRIVVELEDDLFLVIHLMIAGRLRWVPTGAKVPGKVGLAAFDFPNGTLILTEAGSKRRASLWLVRGEESLEHSRRLGEEEIKRLFDATRTTLIEWTERLRKEAAGDFPAKVTAFRDDMAVHGKFGKPCPVCGTPVQRIRYADNETNYCPRCQTEGKLLADRALSRLLKQDWPRTIEELTW